MADLKVIEASAKPARDRDGLFRHRDTWHFKIRVNGRWRQFSTKTANYNDAKKIRRDAIKGAEEGKLPSDLGKARFELAYEAWRASRHGRVSARTEIIEQDRGKVLRRHFSGRRLDTLTPQDIQCYQSRRLEEHAAPKTINLETACLQGMLRWAKLWGRFRDDFKPLPRPRQGPGRALTAEEESRLFAIAAGKPDWVVAALVAVLGANTTMRPGEMRQLRLDDVDLFNKTITVRRSTTKTDAGERVIPMNAAALWALGRLRGRAELLGASAPEHFLLPFRADKRHKPERGNVYDPTRPMRTWKAAWYAMTKAAGLPGLRTHDLRHHCITKLAESGAPDAVIMSLAGHVSPEMLRHYSHIRRQAQQVALDAINSAIPAQDAAPAQLEAASAPSAPIQ